MLFNFFKLTSLKILQVLLQVVEFNANMKRSLLDMMHRECLIFSVALDTNWCL